MSYTSLPAAAPVAITESVRVLACSLALLAAACSAAVTEKAADILVPPDEEKRLGDRLAAQIAAETRALQVPEVVRYVEAVGMRLAPRAQTDYPEMTFQFHSLDDKETVNAFAIPGGHTYILSGLLLEVEDEAELAGVLGHELGHVVARHGPEQLARALGLNLVAALALGQAPNQLAQLAAAIAAQGYMMKHSRDAEREADRLGLDYLEAAGYDPRGLPRFFRKLQELEGREPSAVESFFASHPAPGERAADLEAIIAARGLATGARNTEHLRAAQEALRRHYGVSDGVPGAP